MTYVMSNLHGCYTKFLDMLEKIRFKKSDYLFLLGDLVDFGSESLDLVSDLSMRENVWSIGGEHDRLAFRILSRFDELLTSGGEPDEEYRLLAMKWGEVGGQKIMMDFSRLSRDEREGILDYLGDLPGYESVEVNGEEYLMVHAGISGFKKGKDLDEYDPEDFCLDGGALTYPGATVICGHKPTTEYFGCSGEIVFGDGYIAVDCGAGRGGKLGCLRLEDRAVFYL